MIRRSLRIGIRGGALAGLAFALYKILQARRPSPPLPRGDDPWAALPAREPAPAPPGAAPTPLPAEGRPGHDLTSTAAPEASPLAPSAVPAPATGGTEADDDQVTSDEGEVGKTPEAPVPSPPSAPPAPPSAPPIPQAAAPTGKKARPAAKAAAKKAATDGGSGGARAAARKTAAWVEPDGGVCPVSHPVKAKLRSAVFHLPGMVAYARTTPDRCYRDEAAALADGLRKATR